MQRRLTPQIVVGRRGGVDLDTLADFLKSGCAALGVGSSLMTAQILRDNDWPELTRLAAEFVRAARSVPRA